MTVAIVGVGEVEPAWKHDCPVLGLVVDAVRTALDDAGLSGSQVDGITTEAETLHGAWPNEVGVAIGMRDRRFSAQSSIAGAGVLAAVQLAELAIEAGLADVVVSYYGISLSTQVGGPYKRPCRRRGEGGARDAVRVLRPAGVLRRPSPAVRPRVRTDRRAAWLRADRQRAPSPRRTPGALAQDPLDIDRYLADRVVSDPLRRLDCCLINDAAAAFVITSVERARHLPKRPVLLAGSGFGTKPVTEASYFSQNPPYLEMASVESGRRAFATAGIGPADVDIAEIYDCFAVSVILQLEDLGFAKKGEGAAFAASGAIGPGGSLPTNTHGGLLSQSYTAGAGHVVEAVRQLRGERGEGQIAGAEVALVTGLGAMDHATLVLTTDR